MGESVERMWDKEVGQWMRDAGGIGSGSCRRSQDGLDEMIQWDAPWILDVVMASCMCASMVFPCARLFSDRRCWEGCRVPGMNLSGGWELRGSCWLYAHGFIPGGRTTWLYGLVVHGRSWSIKAGPLRRHHADLNPGSIDLSWSWMSSWSRAYCYAPLRAAERRSGRCG